MPYFCRNDSSQSPIRSLLFWGAIHFIRIVFTYTYLFEIKTKTFRFTAAATRRHTKKAGGSHSWAVRRIRVLNEPRLGPRRLYSVVCNLYVTAAYQCTTVPCSCAVQSTCRTAVCSRVSLQLAEPYKALGNGNLKKWLFIPALVGGVSAQQHQAPGIPRI